MQLQTFIVLAIKFQMCSTVLDSAKLLTLFPSNSVALETARMGWAASVRMHFKVYCKYIIFVGVLYII